jgi:glycosyltransferase involved in cell wall biosynthesis
MTEKLYPYSLGIVVHSNYHASKIKLGYNGPIVVLPLLYENELNMDNVCNNFNGYDSSKINLLTVGHIMPPKRIHSTIQAIGSDKELRRNVHFTCIGYQGDEKYLKLLHEQITKMRLEENIRLLGYVEYDQLANYYKHADIIVNLRYPVFEGASGSLVEQMQLGKIIIVSDTGVYSEMPDDCVIKIDPHNDVKELKRALKDFIRDPQKRDKYGTNAMSYAKKTFSPAHYGEKLFNFIQSVQFLSPLYSLTDVIAQELKTMGISPDMRTFDNISKEIEVLYG